MNFIKFSRLYSRLVKSPRYRRQTKDRPDGAVYLHEEWLAVLLDRAGIIRLIRD